MSALSAGRFAGWRGLAGGVCALLAAAGACAVAAEAATSSAPAAVVIQDPAQAARDRAEAQGYAAPVRAALVEIVGQAENRDRLRAVTALGEGRVDDAAAIKALTGAAKADDATLRAAAVWALGQSGSKNAVPAVKAALADAAPQVRAAACKALAALEVFDVAFPLTDAEASVRLAAAQALALPLRFNFKMPEGMSRLEQIRAIREANAGLRKDVVLQDRIGKELRAKLVGQIVAAYEKETDDTVKVAMLEALPAAEFSKAKPVIKSALLSGNPALHDAALTVLASLPAESAGDAAEFAGNAKTLAAADKPWQLRVRAAWALEKLDPAWVTKTLPAWCADENPRLRATAARVLGLAGDASAVPVLEKMFGDKDYYTRLCVAAGMQALAERKVLALDVLIKTAADAASGDDPLRATVGLWILIERKNPAALPGALKHTAGDLSVDSDRVPVAALTLRLVAATGYKDGADAALKVYLNDKANDNVRLQALGALQALRPASCVEPLAKRLAASKTVDGMAAWTLMGELRRQTVLTILQVGGPAAVDAMLDDILCPKPVEDEELVALICQWLVDTKAVAAAPTIGRAKSGKAFSEYVRQVLSWTEGRLLGKEASAEVPPPSVALPTPSFLSEAKR